MKNIFVWSRQVKMLVKRKFGLRPLEDYLNPKSCLRQQIQALRKSCQLTDTEIYGLLSNTPAKPGMNGKVKSNAKV